MDFKSFSFALLCFISFFALTLLPRGECAKKCSRIFSRIPVQKDFNLKKFAGIWYTVTRTTFVWGKNTFKSFSIEIAENEDGSFQFAYTGQLRDKCLPVESGTVEEEKNRPGQYVLRSSGNINDQPTLIVSFTDYKNLALVYYCFKYRPGSLEQCRKDGMQVEIISKDIQPKKKDLNGYMKRAAKRLCIRSKMLKPSIAGLCKIPDILAAAKQREIDLKDKDTKSGERDQCAVNNVPIQKDFSSSQLQGLWYEIARTRFTFNKMESVVNYHRYDELTNQIYSYYTGTVVNPEDDEGAPFCMTAIQGMSKTVEGGEGDSDRLGRIGWDASTYPWSPTKVLYADDEYILFYACYSGASDDRCKNEYMEATLSGRTRDISLEKRNSIYSILPTICVNPDDMTDTQFFANCSSWVTIMTEDVKPEDCKMDEIQVYDDYISSQLAGTWHLHSSISYNNMTSFNGAVMERKLALNEGIETRMVAFSPIDNNCTDYFSRSRDMCYDTADHITTLPGGDGNFVFSKVLYLDTEILVEYTCSARTVEGTCDRKGIQFNVFTTNDTSDEEFMLTDETQDLINKLAKSVCLDPNDIELQTEWCNISAFVAQEHSENVVDCDIDQIEIFGDMGGYIQEEIYGYWYEVARSSKASRSFLSSAVAYFTSTTNETLNIYVTGPFDEAVNNEEGPVCSDVMHGSMIARCRTDIIGDFLYRFSEADNYTSYVPFKILHTDYTNILVTYMCTEMLPSGQCNETGTKVSIWSRTTTLDEDSRLYVEETILWKCPEQAMVDVHQDNDACCSNLEEYISDNQLDILPEDDTDKGVNAESDFNDGGVDGQEQQSDQGQNEHAISDIDAALFMDDDEFYYGS